MPSPFTHLLTFLFVYLITHPFTILYYSSCYLFDENESQTGVACETIQDQVGPKDAGCTLKDYLLYNHRDDKRIKPHVYTKGNRVLSEVDESIDSVVTHAIQSGTYSYLLT